MIMTWHRGAVSRERYYIATSDIILSNDCECKVVINVDGGKLRSKIKLYRDNEEQKVKATHMDEGPVEITHFNSSYSYTVCVYGLWQPDANIHVCVFTYSV